LYGQNSSQYNKLNYAGSVLYEPIGVTSGYGSLHITDDTFTAMLGLAQDKGVNISNRFGDGPNWRMRVIRSACDILGMDSDFILKHSFQRGLFAVELSDNCKQFLRGESDVPLYKNVSLEDLAKYWRERWLKMRKQNSAVLKQVCDFTPGQFNIEKTNII
jgi:hypothetical protein